MTVSAVSRRALTATLITAALVLTPVAAAAAPTPDSGPVAGGTQVTIELPAAPTGFAQLAASSYQTYAIGNDGLFYAWGGDLGATPQLVATPEGVTYLELRATTSGQSNPVFARGSDERWYAWGNNVNGSLGTGTTVNATIDAPAVVQTPPGVSFVDIASSGETAYAVDENGNLYSWGTGFNGSLGNGTSASTMQPLPTLVVEDVASPFVDVIGGQDMGLALTADGEVYSWGWAGSEGSDWIGALGNGDVDGSVVPVRVALPDDVVITQVSSSTDESSFSLALADDGRLFAWGSNYNAQLGTGAPSFDANPTPLLITAPEGVIFTQIQTLYRSALALDQNGNVWGWGQEAFGELGTGGGGWDPGYSAQIVPASMPEGVTFSTLVGGTTNGFGLTSDGTAYGWGANFDGAIGTGLTGNITAPTAIPFPESAVVLTGVTFGGVAADPALFVDNGDGTWTVTTPPHPAGPYDVIVNYTIGGLAQEPLLYPSGFAFLEAPVLDVPSAELVCTASIQRVDLAVTVLAGFPEPVVEWERSVDGGENWSVIASGDTTTVDVAQLSDLYHARAVNSEGSATTGPITASGVACPTDGGADADVDAAADVDGSADAGADSATDADAGADADAAGAADGDDSASADVDASGSASAEGQSADASVNGSEANGTAGSGAAGSGSDGAGQDSGLAATGGAPAAWALGAGIILLLAGLAITSIRRRAQH
ncbi:RCC1 domain-containing protein [Microbacterium sp. NPDC055903]